MNQPVFTGKFSFNETEKDIKLFHTFQMQNTEKQVISAYHFPPGSYKKISVFSERWYPKPVLPQVAARFTNLFIAQAHFIKLNDFTFSFDSTKLSGMVHNKIAWLS